MADSIPTFKRISVIPASPQRAELYADARTELWSANNQVYKIVISVASQGADPSTAVYGPNDGSWSNMNKSVLVIPGDDVAAAQAWIAKAMQTAAPPKQGKDSPDVQTPPPPTPKTLPEDVDDDGEQEGDEVDPIPEPVRHVKPLRKRTQRIVNDRKYRPPIVPNGQNYVQHEPAEEVHRHHHNHNQQGGCTIV